MFIGYTETITSIYVLINDLDTIFSCDNKIVSSVHIILHDSPEGKNYKKCQPGKTVMFDGIQQANK